MNDNWESSVWLMNADGTHQRSLVQGSDVQWSPDGKRIAYIAKGEPSGQQIFVRWMDAEGAVTQISHLTESAVESRVVARRQVDRVHDERAGEATTWRIAMPTPPKGAKWTEAPKIVTRLNYRSDRVGYTDDAYRHIFVIPADGGTPRQITNGDWNHSGPSFSADGKWIAFSSTARAERRERVPQVADLRRERRDRRDQAAHAPQRHERQSRPTRPTAS